MSNKVFYSTLVAIAVLFGAGVYGFQNGWFSPGDPPVVSQKGEKDSTSLTELSDEHLTAKGKVRIGGVVRDKRNVEDKVRTELASAKGSSSSQIGKLKLISADTNAYTRSVAEAYKNPGKYPERLNAAFAPKPFSQEEFDKDPQKYLTTVEPGRVFQDLTPGPDVKPLKRVSPAFHKLIQGESVALQVEANPNTPVTFYCSEIGHFDNQLGTMTVQADDSGKASVNFTAPSGSFGLVNIAAASPTNSFRAKFVVRVSLPTSGAGNP